jgi:hypothetical protein
LKTKRAERQLIPHIPDFFMETKFKRCTLCGKEWGTEEEFLSDRTVHYNGHQKNKKKIPLPTGTDGLFIFTHLIDECGTSIAIAVSKFKEAPAMA